MTHLLKLVRAASCHPARELAARGLCHSCYTVAYRAGRHTQYPPCRKVRDRADFVADYVLLRSEGHTRHQIAERLGMTYAAVTAAYLRATRAGDLAMDRGGRTRRAA